MEKAINISLFFNTIFVVFAIVDVLTLVKECNYTPETSDILAKYEYWNLKNASQFPCIILNDLKNAILIPTPTPPPPPLLPLSLCFSFSSLTHCISLYLFFFWSPYRIKENASSLFEKKKHNSDMCICSLNCFELSLIGKVDFINNQRQKSRKTCTRGDKETKRRQK